MPNKPVDSGLAALGVLDAPAFQDIASAFVADADRVLRVSVDGECVVIGRSATERRVQALMLALPFAGASFSRVLCIAALRHSTDSEQFLTEARRVLDQAGRLLVVAVEPDARATRGLMVKAGFAWSESYLLMTVERVGEDADILELRVFATTGWMGGS